MKNLSVLARTGTCEPFNYENLSNDNCRATEAHLQAIPLAPTSPAPEREFRAEQALAFFEAAQTVGAKSDNPSKTVFVMASFYDGTSPDIQHIPNDHNAVNTMLSIAKRWTLAGQNVYLGSSLMNSDLPSKQKGTESDIAGVLFLCADFDDEAAQDYQERLPLTPHLVTETSQGRFQCVIFFDRPQMPGVIKPLAEALASHAGADGVSGDLSHVWRVPGTWNFPNAGKIAKGRVPELSRLMEASSFGAYECTSEALKLALSKKWPDAFSKTVALQRPGDDDSFGWDQRSTSNPNRFKPKEIDHHLNNEKFANDRSKGAWHFLKLAKNRGYSPEELVTTLLSYPESLISGHYVGRDGGLSENRIRAEVKRVFAKRDVRLSGMPGDRVYQGFECDSLKASSTSRTRREIKISGGDLPFIVDEAEEALIESDTFIFQRGQVIVRPVRDESARMCDNGDLRRIRLVEVRHPEMIERMTAAADFMTFNKTENVWKSANCPSEIVSIYLARDGLWRLRPLAAVIGGPTLRPDGSVLDKPGYDLATGLLYDPQGISFPPVPVHPTREDAACALGQLKELISTFPFVSDADRSVALSAILTAAIRPSISTAPLHGFTSPVAGAGKGKLAAISTCIAVGRDVAWLAQGRTEEETEKRVASALMSGDATVGLDNCTLPIRGDFLCMVMTQSEVQIRILGQSKLKTIPNTVMFLATGCHLEFAGDMTRRAIRCELDPETETPENITFANDPVEDAKRERPRLLVAALTVLRAYIAAGQPNQSVPLGSFEQWSRWVRDALIWLGEADPCLTMEAIRKEDPEKEQLATILANWSDVIGSERVLASTAIEKARLASATGSVALLDAFQGVAAAAGQGKGNTLVDSRRLGHYFRKVKGRIVNSMRLIEDGAKAGSNYWRLDRMGGLF